MGSHRVGHDWSDLAAAAAAAAEQTLGDPDQVKRMFEAVGKKVTYLKRTEFGTLPLDEDLEEGEYRELTDEELAILKSF